MSSSRRGFLKHVAGGAALTTVGLGAADRAVAAAAPAAHAPGAGHYGYLGRTKDYKDWAVVPRGLTVKKIETFRREMLAMVRLTASDGSVGWGQIAPYDVDLSVEV